MRFGQRQENERVVGSAIDDHLPVLSPKFDSDDHADAIGTSVPSVDFRSVVGRENFEIEQDEGRRIVRWVDTNLDEGLPFRRLQRQLYSCRVGAEQSGLVRRENSR